MAIRVLPIHMVNKIAAGEVVERPASVVKELVENSIDAGATRIKVAVEDGGRRLISVSDDGGGMSPDDAALAFVPHATSKIAVEDDLFAISSMGFRGEALASIAAISHANIRTRRAAEAEGSEISASGEEMSHVRPCAAAPGTTITIRDLFFNTPARRKFMKTANTEFGHVAEQVVRLALPHPQIAFRLVHNGREVQNLPAAESTAQRVADIFGREMADQLIPIRPRGGTISVAGLASTPAAARATAKWQYIFLNGRYIRDRLLSHALREGYRGVVDPQRSPIAFIFIDVPPADVDVNVHPTKIEVRFRDGNMVHGELLASLRETLNRSNLAPSAELKSTGGTAPTGPGDEGDLASADPRTGASPADDQRRASLRQAIADFYKSGPPRSPRLSFPEATSAQAREAGTRMEVGDFFPATFPPPPTDYRQAGHAYSLSRREQAGPQPAAALSAATGTGDTAPAGDLPAMQIHDSYIVAASYDGLVIIDQHALHERLLYNELRRRLEAGPLESQRLLLPEPIRVSQAELAAIQTHQELLEKLGVEVAPFGPDTLAVQQFPLLLVRRGVAAGDFLRELLDRLAETPSAQPEHVLEDAIAMMACKAAVKAGEPLSQQEMAELLARRVEADKGAACPHGRPTTLRLTLKDLQRQFKR